MPGFNQRGPMNEGPMTGRGMGRCATADNPDAGQGTDMQWNPPGYGRGRGMGMGMGMARGRGRCLFPRWGMGAQMPPQPPPIDRQSLAARARQLEAQLQAVQDQLKQMPDE